MAATIVLFEDNPDIRQLVSDVLTENGYAVVHARSLADGRQIVETGRGDVFLADAGETDRGRAIAVLEWLCQEIGRRIPVVIFTAHNIQPEQARQMGCADVLTKPFDIDELLRKMEDHLAQRG